MITRECIITENNIIHEQLTKRIKVQKKRNSVKSPVREKNGMCTPCSGTGAAGETFGRLL
jgi:hypothetical protein